MREQPLFLAGEWQEGAERVEIRAPWDGALLGIAAFGDEATIDRALAAGQAAEATFARLPTHERRSLLSRIARGIAARGDELTALIRDEAGKPVTVARGEVTRAVQTFEFAAEETWRRDEAMDLGAVPTGAGRFGVIRSFPVGLVAAIAPFNFPLNLVAHKLAPAFAAGCPVVLKPAEQTPLTALLLAEICAEAGLPKGGLSVIPAHRGAAGALVEDPRVKLLSFTGSPAVGWAMKARAGKKRVVLELGGDAAAIVHEDADPVQAARRVGFGAYVYAGQVCISVQRVFVHARVYPAFQEALLAWLEEELAVGDPADPKVLCGPLIDDKSATRVLAWIDEAQAKGARLLRGGPREGNLVSPALLEGMPAGARLSSEEAFGPVASLEPYDDLEQAIRRVNDSAFGLQAGVFTDSLRDLWRCYEGLEVGGVIHNDVPVFRVDHMPYGGVKGSGFGREGVPFAVDDYCEKRLLALKPAGPA